jgi:N-acetylneuraminate synthase
LKKILPFTAHLHLADAQGVDGEGLQIKEGEIDWKELFNLMNIYCPNASFIPEIWQGHKKPWRRSMDGTRAIRKLLLNNPK